MENLSRPIPGQSLTDTPKNAPWERPSDMVEVAEVVDYYIARMANDDAMDDLAAIFTGGAPLEVVVNTMIKHGSMNGVHPIQSGMLAAPSIAAFIKSAMETYGIKVQDTLEDPTAAKERRSERRIRMLANAALTGKLGDEPEAMEEPTDLPEEEMPEEASVEAMPEDDMAEEVPMMLSIGLMAKE